MEEQLEQRLQGRTVVGPMLFGGLLLTLLLALGTYLALNSAGRRLHRASEMFDSVAQSDVSQAVAEKELQRSGLLLGIGITVTSAPATHISVHLPPATHEKWWHELLTFLKQPRTKPSSRLIGTMLFADQKLMESSNRHTDEHRFLANGSSDGETTLTVEFLPSKKRK